MTKYCPTDSLAGSDVTCLEAQLEHDNLCLFFALLNIHTNSASLLLYLCSQKRALHSTAANTTNSNQDGACWLLHFSRLSLCVIPALRYT
jgi:hypothetical protein